MSDQDTKIWDGHSQLLGVDTFSDPSQLRYLYCSGAINKTFRGGIIKTRPPLKSLTRIFDNKEDEEVFKKGNITGAINYDSTYEGTQSHLVVAVGDRILKGRIYANTIEFSRLFKGIDPKRVSYFAQAEDRLYWQNGLEDPIGWNGFDPAYKIPGGIENDRMPIGTVMAYVHGRLVVLSGNHLFVSDFIYGNGLTPESPQVESFIEVQASSDLGAIASPASLGPIRSMIAIPVTPNRNAQGELLVLCAKGGFTLSLTGNRQEWFASDILQIVLSGLGSSSAFATVPANNDIWFRRSDGGIGSYSFERSEQDKAWGETSLSREVEQYLKYDDFENLRYCKAMVAHNRLIVTTGLGYQFNSNPEFGPHRFGRGMVVLDFDKGSTINRKSGFAWEGLWTGVCPTALVNVLSDEASRALVLSFDPDEENRIYEILLTGEDDEIDGKRVKIVHSHETILLLDQQDTRQEIAIKKLAGIHAEVSDVANKATLVAEFSPNESEEWFYAGTVEIGEDGLSQSTDVDGLNVIGPELKDFYDIITIGLDDPTLCEQGRLTTANRARGFRVRLTITGKASVPILQVSANVLRDTFFATCMGDASRAKYARGVRVPGEDIFKYKIVTKDG